MQNNGFLENHIQNAVTIVFTYRVKRYGLLNVDLTCEE